MVGGKLMLNEKERSAIAQKMVQVLALPFRKACDRRGENDSLRGSVRPAFRRRLRQLDHAKNLRFPRLLVRATTQKNGLLDTAASIRCGTNQSDNLALSFRTDPTGRPP